MKLVQAIWVAALTFGIALASCEVEKQDDAEVVRVGAGAQIAEWARAAEADGFSGAILAARDGEVVAAFGVGKAIPNRPTSNTSTTLFEIASATKPITANAVMLLVQQGRLGLDDPISDHLPGVPDNCKEITVRHLLQHTSGIPGTNSRGGGDDLDRVLPLFLNGGPVHEPGTHWEYWNQGYSLLSEIIARVSGQEYVTFCKEHLFTPAGMGSTRFTGDDPPKGLVVSVGRSTRGNGPHRSALEHPYGSYGFQYRGMGGAVTNVWDLWQWDRALHGDDLLNVEVKGEMFLPGLNGYALGWLVKRTTTGRLVQSHGGAVRGFVCEIRRYPEENGCLFVLCNNDSTRARQIAQSLEEILFGEQPEPLGIDLVGELVGRYKDVKGNVLSVNADGAVIRADLHWSPPNGPVTHARLVQSDGGDVMLDDGAGSYRIEIERDSDDEIRALSIMGDRYERTR